MNREEITDFLSEPRIAVIATSNKNGTIQLTPNWYRYDGAVLTFITTKERLKYINLKRDNRITICVTEEPLAKDYVVIQGIATFNEDFNEEGRRIVARYKRPEDVDGYVKQWETESRVIVVVTPFRMTSRYR